MVKRLTLEEVRAMRGRPPLSEMTIAQKAARIAALVEKLDAQIKEQSRMLEVLRFRTRTPR